MSAESLRARLEAADPGPWYMANLSWSVWNRVPIVAKMDEQVIQRRDPNAPCSYIAPNADLIAHAPTDLRLALDVIEAAKELLTSYERDCEPPRLQAALDAFEAAP